MSQTDSPSLFSRFRTGLLYRLGVPLLNALDFFIKRASLVGETAILDPQHFPWAVELEQQWPVIREELDALIASRVEVPNLQDISHDLSHLTTDDKWKMLLLFAYGYKSPCNCARCPETTRLLESLPGITNAVFSFLAPGKHIPLHRGEYRGLLRCHLGLIVPQERSRCRMQIAEEIYVWSEGRLLIFDNSYHHEVWNDTDEMRVVLMFDVIRPMRRPWSWLNRLVVFFISKSPYVQSARRNQQRFDAKTASEKAAPLLH